jgi:Fe-S oxidoreductase
VGCSPILLYSPKVVNISIYSSIYVLYKCVKCSFCTNSLTFDPQAEAVSYISEKYGFEPKKMVKEEIKEEVKEEIKEEIKEEDEGRNKGRG